MRTGIPGIEKSRSNGLEKREEKAGTETCRPFSMAEAEFRVGTSQEVSLERRAEARPCRVLHILLEFLDFILRDHCKALK